MSRSADAAGPAPDMIPGEILTQPGEIILNENADCLTIEVVNAGDRPIQVGSHYHFAETNPALRFDRGLARGRRLDVPSGGALRFEPGQTREVVLIPFGGARRVIGFRSEIMGDLD